MGGKSGSKEVILVSDWLRPLPSILWLPRILYRHMLSPEEAQYLPEALTQQKNIKHPNKQNTKKLSILQGKENPTALMHSTFSRLRKLANPIQSNHDFCSDLGEISSFPIVSNVLKCL